MSNVFKGYRVALNEDTRVVDVSEQLQRRLQEEEEKRIRLQAISNESYDSDEFFEGLPVAENLDAILDEDAESAVIKAENQEELNRVNEELENALIELEDAKTKAAAIVTNANIEAEDIKKRAYADGHAAGYNDGMAEAQAEMEDARNLLNMEAEELHKDYEEKIGTLEPRFIDALTDIYEHIFKVDLDTYRNVVSSLLVDAINGSDNAKNIMVHVAREDYQRVLEQREEILAETGMPEENVEFIQDATLGEACCFIETENGVFDCSLETELKELKRKLMLLAYRK